MNTYARALATLFGASVLCPSYRFAPEHPFPTGIKDAWAVVQWAASHAEGLSADPVSQGFLLGGVSSGANFAVALTRHAVEAGLHPRVTGVWAPLFIGCVSPEHVPDRYGEVYVSHEQNADALVIDKGKAATMWEYYKPENASPLFNPLAVGAGLAFDLGRMPKVCLQVAGQDLFRDDGLVLGYALRDAGAQVRVDVYPGVPHSFWVFAPSVEVSRECIRDMVEGFAWLLGVAIEDLPQGWEVAMVAPSIKLDDKV
jgi:acetyl esterase/lipase